MNSDGISSIGSQKLPKKFFAKWSRRFPECRIQQLYLRTSGETEKNRMTVTWREYRKDYRAQQKS